MKTTTLALVLALVACHHDKKATTTPVVKDDKPAPTQEQKPAPPVAADQKVSTNLAVSGDLVSQCGIKSTPSAANPKFDYDKDELTKDDRDVLDQLAQCLVSGPLKGKAVALIGRADPRGTEEYNLGLGSRRAGAVGKYLEHLGVQDPQLAVTTRGSLDATGTDEAGWAADRRVDVQLKQD
jgi:outer membrane protein OmpA-like peptidoglycan-associated protein